MNRIKFAVCLVVLFILSACTAGTPTTINPKVLPTATPPTTPESGLASVYGQIQGPGGKPMGDVSVMLADVARGASGKGGAFILDVPSSPSTYTDQNGFFSFKNIDAGEYVVVVGSVESGSLYEIVRDAESKAKVWNFPADQLTDVGVIQVSLVIPTLVPTPASIEYPGPTAYPIP